ncbi:MAG: zinc ABC transporter substrate-binding protein [Lentisphaeria bacterium]
MKLRNLWLVSLCLCVSISEIIQAGELPVIFVSILPQLEAVREIGKNICEGDALLAYGQSPEMFQFDARTIESLRKSPLYLGIGLPFEQRLFVKLQQSLPELKLVDASKNMHHRCFEGVKHIMMITNPQTTTPGTDPHVWLSIQNMMLYANTVQQNLILLFPDQKETIVKNAAAYCIKLGLLQKQLQDELRPYHGQQILVYHPAFGYFLDDLGLSQKAVEKNGKAPTGKYLESLMMDIPKLNISTLFCLPQFNDRFAKMLAHRLNLKLVKIDPLPENYSEGLKKLASQIRDSMEIVPAEK